jgi:hypothetical protein
MNVVETKLKKLGLEVPPMHPHPSPNRRSGVQVGNILFLSGHDTGRQVMPLNIKPTVRQSVETFKNPLACRATIAIGNVK